MGSVCPERSARTVIGRFIVLGGWAFENSKGHRPRLAEGREQALVTPPKHISRRRVTSQGFLAFSVVHHGYHCFALLLTERWGTKTREQPCTTVNDRERRD